MVETSGAHWVYQDIRQLRAVSDVSTVHQDWDWISPGLAQEAISQGWWPGDGSKLDFAEALCTDRIGQESGLRRWGRATLLLEQQNSRIDLGFIRRLLSDHYEGCNEEVDPLDVPARPVPLCQHASGSRTEATAASLVVQLPAAAERLPVAWCAFGPPCINVYFPIFLEAELPEAFSSTSPEPATNRVWQRMRQVEAYLGNSRERWASVHEQLGRLQGQLDHEAEDFAVEGAALKQQGAVAELERLASLFVQHCLERFDKVFADLRPTVSSYQPSTPVSR
jgi:dipeptidase